MTKFKDVTSNSGIITLTIAQDKQRNIEIHHDYTAGGVYVSHIFSNDRLVVFVCKYPDIGDSFCEVYLQTKDPDHILLKNMDVFDVVEGVAVDEDGETTDKLNPFEHLWVMACYAMFEGEDDNEWHWGEKGEHDLISFVAEKLRSVPR